MVRRPPHGQRSTSVPKVSWCNVAQSRRRFVFFFGGTTGPRPRRSRHLRVGLAGDERAQGGIGRVDTVETRQVQLRRWQQGHQAPHEGHGGEGEGDSLLRRVLVAAVLEAAQATLRDRSPGAIPAQPLEPCLSCPCTAVSASGSRC
jgi:hypothetical protein